MTINAKTLLEELRSANPANREAVAQSIMQKLGAKGFNAAGAPLPPQLPPVERQRSDFRKNKYKADLERLRSAQGPDREAIAREIYAGLQGSRDANARLQAIGEEPEIADPVENRTGWETTKASIARGVLSAPAALDSGLKSVAGALGANVEESPYDPIMLQDQQSIVGKAVQPIYDVLSKATQPISQVSKDIMGSDAIRASSAAEGFHPLTGKWWLENLPQTASQLGSQMLGAAMTGGAGPVAKFAGFAAPVFVQEAGQAYDDALADYTQRGIDPQQAAQAASWEAFGVGVVNTALEKLPFEEFVQKNPLLKKALSHAVLKKMPEWGINVASGAITEGGEEILQSVVSNAAKALRTGEIDPLLAWEEYAAGGLLGALAGGPLGAVQNRNDQAKADDAPAIEANPTEQPDTSARDALAKRLLGLVDEDGNALPDEVFAPTLPEEAPGAPMQTVYDLDTGDFLPSQEAEANNLPAPPQTEIDGLPQPPAGYVYDQDLQMFIPAEDAPVAPPPPVVAEAKPIDKLKPKKQTPKAVKQAPAVAPESVQPAKPIEDTAKAAEAKPGPPVAVPVRTNGKSRSFSQSLENHYSSLSAFDKGAFLEYALVSNRSADEIDAIFNKVIKGMPNESRILYAITQKKNASDDIRAKAQSRYDQLTAQTPAAKKWQAKDKPEPLGPIPQDVFNPKSPDASAVTPPLGKRTIETESTDNTPGGIAGVGDTASPQKQPWEMTRDEFLENQGNSGAYAQQQRAAVVKQAVKSGKPVPAAVLQDYAGEPWADAALAKMQPADVSRETASRVNEHGVLQDFETIPLSFPKSVKGKADVKVGLAPDGKWRHGLRIIKNFGSHSGYGHAPSVEMKGFDTKEEAVSAAKRDMQEWAKREFPEAISAIDATDPSATPKPSAIEKLKGKKAAKPAPAPKPPSPALAKLNGKKGKAERTVKVRRNAKTARSLGFDNMKGGTIWNRIRAMGGIRDTGTEISTIFGGKNQVPPRTVNNTNGLTLDDVGRMLWEAGIAPEDTAQIGRNYNPWTEAAVLQYLAENGDSATYTGKNLADVGNADDLTGDDPDSLEYRQRWAKGELDRLADTDEPITAKKFIDLASQAKLSSTDKTQVNIESLPDDAVVYLEGEKFTVGREDGKTLLKDGVLIEVEDFETLDVDKDSPALKEEENSPATSGKSSEGGYESPSTTPKKKKLILVNSSNPDLSKMAAAAGHKITKIHKEGARTFADFDGKKMSLSDIKQYLLDRYRFEEMLTGNPKMGTGIDLFAATDEPASAIDKLKAKPKEPEKPLAQRETPPDITQTKKWIMERAMRGNDPRRDEGPQPDPAQTTGPAGLTIGDEYWVGSENRGDMTKTVAGFRGKTIFASDGTVTDASKERVTKGERAPDLFGDVRQSKREDGERTHKQIQSWIQAQIAKGGEHLAPNGKKSNLNAWQYWAVRTPEFKAWFGDWENSPKNASKVVDENGEPLVVYHGTDRSFDRFAKKKRGLAYYFTPDADQASSYSGRNGANVVPAYIKAEKIYEGGLKDEILAAVKNADDAYPYTISKVGEWLDNQNPSAFHIKSVVDELKKHGYDGFVEVENGVKQYGVFSPSQIKSATGNRGTYDSSDPDIRKSATKSTPEERQAELDFLKAHREIEANPAFAAEKKLAESFNAEVRIVPSEQAAYDDAGADMVAMETADGLIFFSSKGGADAKAIIYVITGNMSLKKHPLKVWEPVRVLRHEVSHLLVRRFGQDTLLSVSHTIMGPNEKAQMARRYPRERNESDMAYRKRLADEWLAKLRSTDSRFKRLVDAVVEALMKIPQIRRYVMHNPKLAAVRRAALGRAVTREIEARANRGAKARHGKGAAVMASIAGKAKMSQTETPEFKRWFGDSKVVDAEGKPLVVYHGRMRHWGDSPGNRTHDFQAFERGRGMHKLSASMFSDDSQYASGFALFDGGNVVPAYLRMENPILIQDTGDVASSLSNDLWEEMTREEQVGIKRHDEAYGTKATWRAADLLLQIAEKYGYDGVIWPEGKGKTFVPIEPTQIKSATGNQGTFDPTNPDIRKSVVEDVAKEADAEAAKRVPVLLKLKGKALMAKLPDSWQRLLTSRFSQDPNFKKFFEEIQSEMGKGRRLSDAILRTVTATGASDTERMILSRMLRGGVDFKDLMLGVDEREASAMLAKKDMLKTFVEVTDQWTEYMQEYTTLADSLGLPVREEFRDGPVGWYPNYFAQHEGSMIMGKLFSKGMKEAGANISRLEQKLFKPTVLKTDKGERGHALARKTDRWYVVDKTGKTLGNKLFKTEAEAQAYLDENKGFFVKYYDRELKKEVVEMFETAHERQKFINEGGVDIGDGYMTERRIRVKSQWDGAGMKLVAPMTYQEMLAHGLLEDLTLNVRRGVRQSTGLIAKTQFFDKLAQYLLEMDDGTYFIPKSQMAKVGYVPLDSLGIIKPPVKDGANPAIDTLFDGYVREDLAKDIAGVFGRKSILDLLANNPVERELRSWVTYRNPFRHIKQVGIENPIQLFMADGSIFLDMIHGGKNVRAALREYASHMKNADGDTAPFLQEFIDEGFPATDFVTAEFSSYRKALGEFQTDQSLSAFSAAMERIVTTGGKASLRNVNAMMETAYHHEDLFFKYLLYRGMRARGESIEAAAEKVRQSMFDWENAPRLVKALRFVPFSVSVNYQFGRVFANLLKAQPATTMLKLSILGFGLMALRDLWDEKEGINRDKRKDLRAFDIILPVTDGQGRNLKFSMGNLIPFAELNRIIPPVPYTGEGLSRWPGYLNGLTPMSLKGIWTLANRTWYGGQVYYSTDTENEKLLKTAAQFGRDYMPGMAGAYWMDLYRNAQKKEKAKQPVWAQAVTGPALGVKSDIDNSRYYREPKK